MIAMFVHVLDDRAVSYVTTTVARKIAESGTDVVIVAAATTPGGLARAGDLPVVDLGGAVDNKTSRVVVRLARWLRATQVSVLFAQGEGPGRTAVLARGISRSRTKVVVVEHTHAASFRRRNRLRELATGLLYPRAAAVAGVAPAIVHALETRHPALRGRTVVLPSIGPDRAEVQRRTAPAPDHPWFEESPRPFVITSVGNVVPRKGQETLVRALPRVRAQLGDARLLLIGRIDDEPFAKKLSELAHETGVGEFVSFVGFLSEPLPLVARSDVAALASQTEGLPMVLVEAFACGVPVVAADGFGGVADLLAGGSGVLVPVDDPDATADAIVRVAQDAELRATLIERGLARASEFTPAAVAARYLEVADVVTAPARRASPTMPSPTPTSDQSQTAT